MSLSSMCLGWYWECEILELSNYWSPQVMIQARSDWTWLHYCFMSILSSLAPCPLIWAREKSVTSVCQSFKALYQRGRIFSRRWTPTHLLSMSSSHTNPHEMSGLKLGTTDPHDTNTLKRCRQAYHTPNKLVILTFCFIFFNNKKIKKATSKFHLHILRLWSPQLLKYEIHY